MSRPAPDCGEEALSRGERLFKRIHSPIEEFIHHEATSGMVLMGCAVLAMLVANSRFLPWYEAVLHTKIAIHLGGFSLSHTVHHWINDGLMGLFFFVVGLEIKREMLVGELADIRKAVLPVVAAMGGMVAPALFYVALNGGATRTGWAIPMATDIAFAVGVLVLLGNRVPKALMGFLLALAIVDDLGAVLVIAFFYTAEIIWSALAVAAGCFVLLLAVNMAGIRRPLPYFLLGTIMWLAMLLSGVHATLAGVLTALTVPANSRCATHRFQQHMAGLLERFGRKQESGRPLLADERQQGCLQGMEHLVHLMESPLQRLEHGLHHWVSYLILPLFALANAGIVIDMAAFADIIRHPVTSGVIVGLVVGKAIGIFVPVFLLVRFASVPLPRGMRLPHVLGVALLAGIGFTMAIFIGELAFSGQEALLTNAKIGVVLASIIAGAGGAFWLYNVGGGQGQGVEEM